MTSRTFGLSLLGALLLTSALGCSGGSRASKPSDPSEGGAAAQLAAGDYACSFTGYPEYLCRVTGSGAQLTLEKLGGSDRFRGTLSAQGKDVRWVNAVRDSDPAELVFQQQADGSWFAKLPSDGEVVGYRVRALGPLGSQFGGESYGGAISETPGT